jgi:hypothetical protein
MDDNTKELGITSKEYVNDIRVYIKTCTHYHSYDHTPPESHTPHKSYIPPKSYTPLRIGTHPNYSLTYPIYPFSSPPLASKHKKAS